MEPRDEALYGLERKVDHLSKWYETGLIGLKQTIYGLHRQLTVACETIARLRETVEQQTGRIEWLEAMVASLGPGSGVEEIVDLDGDALDLGKLSTDNEWIEPPSGIDLSKDPPSS